MAFIPVISLTEAKDGKTIYVSDITGAYDSVTNPGGYGASQVPVGFRTTSGILGSKLRILLPKSDIFLSYINISSVDAQNMIDGYIPYPITSSTIGGSAGDILDDGVYKTEYIIVFGTAASNITVTQNSNVVACSDTGQFVGARYLIIRYGDIVEKTYEIAAVGTTDITLTTPYLEATETISDGEYFPAYLATAYIACTVNINIALHSKIAALATEDCDCKCSKVNKTAENLALFFSIEANMENGCYDKAQTVIDSMTKNINKNTGCGCH